MRLGRLFLLFVVAAVLSGAEMLFALTDQKIYYVSKEGNDNWSGEYSGPRDGSDGPFATVHRAQRAVREYKSEYGLPEKGISVIIRSGVYILPEALEFTSDDSGQWNRPIVYKSAQGEKVTLTGSRKVKDFVLHKDKIYKTDLASLGLKGAEFSRLYYNGRRQHLARVPNFDEREPLYGGFAYVPQAIDNGDAAGLTYDPNIISPGRWHRPEKAIVDIFPGYNYGNRRVRIEAVDFENNIIKLEKSIDYKPVEGDRFFVENVFEELDSPGEWYLNEEESILYFWPPAANATQIEVVVPVTDTLVKFEGGGKDKVVHDIKLIGLNFDICKKTAVVLSQAEDCTIAGCTISNTGEYGIELEPLCKSNSILSNDLTQTGSYAIFLSAPLFKHEQNSGNIITNNHIYRYGTVMKEIAGVGIFGGGDNVVSHNLIHHSPRWGIFINSGARNLLEYNHIHHMSLETEDTGAIYCGTAHGGWEPNLEPEANKLHRGNIIRYNLIHDTLGYGKTGWWNTQKGVWTKPYYSWSIYLDLATSGTLIFGNVCYNSHLGGLAVGGGRDNIARNNIFVNGEVSQICTIKWDPDPPNEDISIKFNPQGNRFERNIICYSNPDAFLYWFVYQYGSKWQDNDFYFNNNLIWHYGKPLKLQAAGLDEKSQWETWLERGMDTESIIAEPGFVNASKNDYRLKPDSPAWRLGFEEIPIEKIGLYKDNYRKTLP